VQLRTAALSASAGAVEIKDAAIAVIASFSPMRFMTLVPTFRSSSPIAAPAFTNFGKSWALANLLVLVPLYRSEIPDRIRRL
jgi:hypothetical protein